MRKIISLVLALILVSSFVVSCAKNNPKNGGANTTAADQSTQLSSTAETTAEETQPSEHTDNWLDADSHSLLLPSDTQVLITEITSDYFMAVSTSMSSSYSFKITYSDGQMDGYCVGDQILVNLENVYVDNNMHGEAKLLFISELPEIGTGMVCYKPVIYLYPEQDTDVSVKLSLHGDLTCTYPKYNDGWNVVASPNGTLTDEKGITYNYLYWEGDTHVDFDFSQGYCIKGSDTAEFLETVLEQLGLNRKEANEFIVYWLPLMESNEYNVISFQTDTYTDAAKLDITPAPGTIIRVFMAWYSSDSFIELDAPKIGATERNGFTVVEWGGTKIK